MELEPIEGESLGSDYVQMFVEFVYSAMCTADTAGYFTGAFRSVVDRLDDLGIAGAELARYRKVIERATGLVQAMETEAVKAAELTPVLLRAAAFDAVPMRMDEQWRLAVHHVERIGALWSRLTGSAVPGARRAASLAVHALAYAEFQRRQKADSTHPSGDGIALGAGWEADVLDDLFNDATNLLATTANTLPRVDAVPTKNPRAMLDSLVGVVAHLRAQTPAVMTVFASRRPQRFVRVHALQDGTALIESVGNAGLDEGEKITAAQRKVLVALGFKPPSQRKHERNWRLSAPELSLIAIPVTVSEVMVRVHGLSQGESLRVEAPH